MPPERLRAHRSTDKLLDTDDGDVAGNGPRACIRQLMRQLARAKDDPADRTTGIFGTMNDDRVERGSRHRCKRGDSADAGASTSSS